MLSLGFLVGLLAFVAPVSASCTKRESYHLIMLLDSSCSYNEYKPLLDFRNLVVQSLQGIAAAREERLFYSQLSYGSDSTIDMEYTNTFDSGSGMGSCWPAGSLVTPLQIVVDLIKNHAATHSVVLLLRFRRGAVDPVSQLSPLQQLQAMGARVVAVDALNGDTLASALGAGIGLPSENQFTVDTFASDGVQALYQAPAVAQALHGDYGRACTFVSPGLVQTYDGKTYGFAGVGDYALATIASTSSTFSITRVAVRNSWCKSGDKKQSHTGKEQKPCTTAVAVTTKNGLAVSAYVLFIDVESGSFYATLNGVPFEIPLASPNNKVYGYKEIPGDIFHVIFDDGSQALNITYIEGSLVVSFFPATYYPTYGLCGYFDGCADNDLRTVDGQVLLYGNESARSWLLSPESSPFESFNFAAYRLGRWFEAHFPLISRQPTVSVPTKINSKCSSDFGTGWLYQMCQFDRKVFSRQADDALSKLPSWLCTSYCHNRRTPHSGIANDPSVCAPFCDFQMLALSSSLPNFNPHTTYDSLTLPTVNVAAGSTNDQATFFLPMGGDYVFSVGAYDCCSDQNNLNQRNVTISVSCAGEITIDAGDNISYTLDTYGFPLVSLDADISTPSKYDTNIHVSWRFLSWPSDGTGLSVIPKAPPPTLINQYSLTPSFFPTIPGNYTLQVVAFDGCLQAFDTVTVHIRCLNTSWALKYSTSLSYVWSGTQYPSYSWDFYQQCSPIDIPTADIYTVELNPLYTLQPFFSWKRIDDFNWILGFDTGVKEYDTITSTTTSTQEDTQNSVVHPISTSDNFDHRWGIINYKKTTEQINTTNTTREHIWAQMIMTECTISTVSTTNTPGLFKAEPGSAVGPAPSDYLLNEMAYQPYLTRHLPDVFAQCEGRYNAKVTMRGPWSCENFTLTMTLDYTCHGAPIGPLAHTLTPSVAVQFDYSDRSFPELQLEGRDTSDRDSRFNVHYWWSTIQAPTNQTGNWINAETPNPYLQLPPVPGVYRVQMFVSNKCRTDTDTIDITANCPGTVTIAPCSLSPSNLHWNYTAGNDVWISLNGSAATGQSATLQYSWAFSSYPAAPFDPILDTTVDPISYLSNYIPQNPYRTFLPYAAGQYVIDITASDGCKSEQSQCTLIVSCDNDIQISALAEPSTFYWGGIAGFPLIHFYDVVHTGIDLDQHLVKLERQTNATLDNWTNVWTPAWRTLSTLTNTTTWIPNALGHYRVTFAASDGCRARAASAVFDVECPANTLTPYIHSAQGRYWYEGNSLVTLDASHSTGSLNMTTYPLTYAWSLTSPSDIVTSLGAGVTALFRASQFGEYIVALTVSDGCTSATDTMKILVACLNQDFSAKAQSDAPQGAVTWTGKKFPFVTVDGASSYLGSTNLTAYDFNVAWTFLEAPPTSLFKGRDNVVHVFVVITNTTRNLIEQPDTSRNNVSSYMWHQINVTTLTISHTVTTQWSVLRMISNHDINTATVNEGWIARFRPDIPGFYKLELSITPSTRPCYTSVSTVTIDARCNSPPNLVFSPPKSGTVFQRISLDASGSNDPDNDPITFLWTLILCNAGSDSTPSEVINHLGPHASWVPQRAGSYCLNLTISDGCSTVTQDWVMPVECPREYEAPPEMDAKYTFDGIGQQELVLDIADYLPDKDTNPRLDDALAPFLWQYKWKLVSYVPTMTFNGSTPKHQKVSDGGIAGAVIGSVAGAVIIGAIVGAAVYFVLRKK